MGLLALPAHPFDLFSPRFWRRPFRLTVHLVHSHEHNETPVLQVKELLYGLVLPAFVSVPLHRCLQTLPRLPTDNTAVYCHPSRIRVSHNPSCRVCRLLQQYTSLTSTRICRDLKKKWDAAWTPLTRTYDASEKS